LFEFTDTIGPLTFVGGRVSTDAAGKLILNGNVTAQSSNSIALLEGNVDFGNDTRSFDIQSESSLNVVAALSAVPPNGLVKEGGGLLNIQSTNSVIFYVVNAPGTIVFDGNNTASVGSNGGTIGGRGQIGQLSTSSVATTLIQPGVGLGVGGFPARLKTNNVLFSNKAEVRFRVENGILGGISDQLVVNGAVALSDAKLTLLTNLNPSPFATAPIVLIDNDGNDSVSGIFVDLPEGKGLVFNNQAFTITYSGGDGNDVALVPVPTPVISISNDVTINENVAANTKASFVISLDRAYPLTVTVHVATGSGFAQEGQDFIGIFQTFTFAANETSKTVNITIVNDTEFENNESFTLNLSNPSNAAIGSGQSQRTVIIVSDDPQPPAITVGDVSVNESTGKMSFVVSGINLLSSLKLNYRLSPSITPTVNTLSDIVTDNLTGSVTLTPSNTSATVTISIVDDKYFEPVESFGCNRSRGCG
jgi:hypothetical protein